MHVFVSGGTWDWYRPIYPGDRIFAYAGEESLEIKQSELGGRSAIQVRRDVALNHRGEAVGVFRILRVVAERKTAWERGKNASIEPAHYTDADYEREEHGRHLVDLKLTMTNQRDVETSYATATVSLPSRAEGLPPLPPTPVDLQRQTAAMYARHNELSEATRSAPR